MTSNDVALHSLIRTVRERCPSGRISLVDTESIKGRLSSWASHHFPTSPTIVLDAHPTDLRYVSRFDVAAKLLWLQAAPWLQTADLRKWRTTSRARFVHGFPSRSVATRSIDSSLGPRAAGSAYTWHLERLNGFRESDPIKRGSDDFFRMFEALLESIAKAGFDEGISLIPVDRNLSPIDGAHRLAIASLLDIPVTVAVSRDELLGFDYRFFRPDDETTDRAASSHVDLIASRLPLLLRNPILAFIWPRGDAVISLADMARSFGGEIVFQNMVTLPLGGVREFLRKIYVVHGNREGWLDLSDADPMSLGAKIEVTGLGVRPIVRVVLIDSRQQGEAEYLVAKKALRSRFDDRPWDSFHTVRGAMESVESMLHLWRTISK